MTTLIPDKCFISRSYRDSEALAVLRAVLPQRVNPYVFPPIHVRPDEFVSTVLIEAILRQDGLIYLLGGHSGRSFWVAFERDYGLRSKRQVFSFDSSPPSLRPEEGGPRDVFVYPSYSHRDKSHVLRIIDYMVRERFFNVWIDSGVIGDPESSLRRSIQSIIDKGGYAVLFWSEAASHSSYMQMEMKWVWEYKKNRILVALLEDTPPPTWLGNDLPPWLYPVQLFGDADHSEINRWDNLIVRLYWLVYNNHELG